MVSFDVSPSDAVDSEEMGHSEPTQTAGIFDVIFRTGEGQPIGQIQAEYGCDKATALVLRGITKMASTNGLPAICDVVAGVFLKTMSVSEESAGESNPWEDLNGGVDAESLDN